MALNFGSIDGKFLPDFEVKVLFSPTAMPAYLTNKDTTILSSIYAKIGYKKTQ